MTTMMTIAAFAAALAIQPTGAHSGHQTAVSPNIAEEAAVRSVLSQYKSAIERLDATGTETLFVPDSAIFETGGVEGTYSNYLAHHLGPELKHFKSFRFDDYKADVRVEGPIALANESYTYRIELEDGRTVDRQGVATSVLKKIGGEWKILSMHNSGRTPKVKK